MTPKTCSECTNFKVKDNIGECPKNKWHIDLELAKRQAVCDDTTTGKVENIQVLTPLGQKSLISKEAYDKEKSGENFWKLA